MRKRSSATVPVLAPGKPEPDPAREKVRRDPALKGIARKLAGYASEIDDWRRDGDWLSAIEALEEASAEIRKVFAAYGWTPRAGAAK